MKTVLLYRFLMTLVIAAALPVAAKAAGTPLAASEVAVVDTVPSRKPEAKPEKKPENKPVDKPEIKEVPKSKRQIRPKAVDERIRIKPPVKVKPDVIKRPNIIRKPSVHIKHGR